MGICRVSTVVNSKAFRTMQRFLLGVALCMVLFLSVQTSANQDGATLLNDLIDEAPLTQDVEKATEPIVDIENALVCQQCIQVPRRQVQGSVQLVQANVWLCFQAPETQFQGDQPQFHESRQRDQEGCG